MVKVKICGVTRVNDALSCAELGADFIGNIVDIPSSPRNVTHEKSREIMSALPANVKKVIVMAPATLEDVAGAFETIRPDCIQLHGDETLEFVEEIKDGVDCEIVKAVHVRGVESSATAVAYSKVCDAILLDTYTAGLGLGGSGQTHNWRLSSSIVKKVKSRVFLAGGLTSENVGTALERVDPYCVDVSSGVEVRPGVKDLEKVRSFIDASKR